MPRRTRIAAIVTCAALLAAPSLAVAQSGGAGDQQYQDPFSGQQNGSKGSGSSGSSSSSGLSQSAPSSGTAAAPVASAPASGTTGAQGGQLAQTGIDLRLLAGAGLLLLVAGIALRRSGHARR